MVEKFKQAEEEKLDLQARKAQLAQDVEERIREITRSAAEGMDILNAREEVLQEEAGIIDFFKEAIKFSEMEIVPMESSAVEDENLSDRLGVDNGDAQMKALAQAYKIEPADLEKIMHELPTGINMHQVVIESMRFFQDQNLSDDISHLTVRLVKNGGNLNGMRKMVDNADRNWSIGLLAVVHLAMELSREAVNTNSPQVDLKVERPTGNSTTALINTEAIRLTAAWKKWCTDNDMRDMAGKGVGDRVFAWQLSNLRTIGGFILLSGWTFTLSQLIQTTNNQNRDATVKEINDLYVHFSADNGIPNQRMMLRVTARILIRVPVLPYSYVFIDDFKINPVIWKTLFTCNLCNLNVFAMEVYDRNPRTFNLYQRQLSRMIKSVDNATDETTRETLKKVVDELILDEEGPQKVIGQSMKIFQVRRGMAAAAAVMTLYKGMSAKFKAVTK